MQEGGSFDNGVQKNYNKLRLCHETSLRTLLFLLSLPYVSIYRDFQVRVSRKTSKRTESRGSGKRKRQIGEGIRSRG